MVSDRIGIFVFCMVRCSPEENVRAHRKSCCGRYLYWGRGRYFCWIGSNGNNHIIIADYHLAIKSNGRSEGVMGASELVETINFLKRGD